MMPARESIFARQNANILDFLKKNTDIAVFFLPKGSRLIE